LQREIVQEHINVLPMANFRYVCCGHHRDRTFL